MTSEVKAYVWKRHPVTKPVCVCIRVHASESEVNRDKDTERRVLVQQNRGSCLTAPAFTTWQAPGWAPVPRRRTGRHFQWPIQDAQRPSARTGISGGQQPSPKNTCTVFGWLLITKKINNKSNNERNRKQTILYHSAHRFSNRFAD